ncbi:MAG: DUF983 domain-containing protein [Rhodospirillales bacterium]|nr:DUF983 domain-containing protein [Rhodospirillales bacterium]MDE2197574.1 DUF983 domain-containing protein [Rhodospirillales bacterium]MDE2577032.1 DUF983 domain-containing protein [Rhodospirillales bacterium]
MKAPTLSQALPVRWQPDRAPKATPWPVPSLASAMARGFAGRCPACGTTRLFCGYLRVVDACGACGAPLGELRADDAPPYFTIAIVGHIIILGMLMLEKAASPPLWVHAAIWLPLTTILSLTLLRPIKGATVGLMLKLGMFKSDTDG